MTNNINKRKSILEEALRYHGRGEVPKAIAIARGAELKSVTTEEIFDAIHSLEGADSKKIAQYYHLLIEKNLIY